MHPYPFLHRDPYLASRKVETQMQGWRESYIEVVNQVQCRICTNNMGLREAITPILYCHHQNILISTFDEHGHA